MSPTGSPPSSPTRCGPSANSLLTRRNLRATRCVEIVMAQRDASVDAAALHAVANRFDDAGHLIDAAVRIHFGRLAFDGAVAGRAYIGHGDAVRLALHRLSGELSQWARATAEIANALRAGADRYAEADQHAAARIG